MNEIKTEVGSVARVLAAGAVAAIVAAVGGFVLLLALMPFVLPALVVAGVAYLTFRSHRRSVSTRTPSGPPVGRSAVRAAA